MLSLQSKNEARFSSWASVMVSGTGVNTTGF